MGNYKRGKGIAGKHSTIIDAARPVVEAVRKLPDTRITLGFITTVKGKAHRKVKFFETDSGFRMKITGNIYVQEFYVITKNRARAVRAVNDTFNAA